MLKNIPTNIITGFLGTGKTSTIRHLLKLKPKNERWAILVNEFGEIGLDGNIYQSDVSGQKDVFIRTVPGGCMCCASGIPMQIALNVLLSMSRPHRLFIEPSGIGYPKEVMSLLFSKYYIDVLDIQKTLTLLDPRKLELREYISHPIFKQQLEIADIIIANKSDLCTDKQLNHINTHLSKIGIPNKVIYNSKFGQITPDILLGKTSFKAEAKIDFIQPETQSKSQIMGESSIPNNTGFIMSRNSGEGYQSIGWRYRNGITFSKKLLVNWFKSQEVERLKAIIHTDEGIFGFNINDGYIQESNVKGSSESRIEIISKHVDELWTDCLNSCIIENIEIINENNSVLKVGVGS